LAPRRIRGGRKAFSYTPVFWFKLAMASARSRNTPLLPAGRRLDAVKAKITHARRHFRAKKATLLPRKRQFGGTRRQFHAHE
jgi:hypothetical protein